MKKRLGFVNPPLAILRARRYAALRFYETRRRAKVIIAKANVAAANDYIVRFLAGRSHRAPLRKMIAFVLVTQWARDVNIKLLDIHGLLLLSYYSAEKDE